MLTFGQHPNTPASIAETGLPGKRKNPDANKLAADMLLHVQKAQGFLMSSQARQKCFADEKRRDATFSIGQYVKLSTKKLAQRAKGTPKLHPNLLGHSRLLKGLARVPTDSCCLKR